MTVTADAPLEVKVTPSVALEFTVTSPKLRLVGLTVNCDVAVPVPLRLTTVVGFDDAVLVIVSEPVVAPAVVGANFTLSVVAWFGFRVIGKVAPDTVNPVPLIVANVIVSGMVPFEVNVTGRVALDPTATLPKLRLVGLTAIPAVPVPVPLKLTVAVGLVDELLLIVSVPVAEPAAVGANFTVSVSVCLGLSVTGNVAPDTVNPVPLTAAEFTVTAPVPVEVSVTDCVALDPTVTLPKLRLAGLTVNVGVPVPVPLRLTVAVGLVDELLSIVSPPVTVPAAVGANFTPSVNVCFGFSVTGSVAPDTVNPAPLTATEFTITAPVPDEVSVTDCVALDPIATLPKLRLAALTVSCGTVIPVPPRLTMIDFCLCALLLIVSVPAAEPAAVGANVTFSIAVWVGFNVSGNVAPDTVKPVPLIVAELIVNGAVPVEVIVNGSVALDPIPTSPKFRAVVLTVNCGLDAACPELVSLTTVVAFVGESLLIVSVPVFAPVVIGAACTWSVAFCCGFRVSGKVAPLTVKPSPLTATELIVNAAVPVEVSVTGSVALDPSVTLPKLRLVVLTASVAVPEVAIPKPLRAPCATVFALEFNAVNCPE